MGTRRELRKKVALSVRIFGTDATGRIFSEAVSTVNVSYEGALLNGVNRPIKPGEIIGLTYGKTRPASAYSGQVNPGRRRKGKLGCNTSARRSASGAFRCPSEDWMSRVAPSHPCPEYSRA